MDNREGQQENARAWSNAETDGQPMPETPHNGGLKPMSSLRAIPVAQPPQGGAPTGVAAGGQTPANAAPVGFAPVQPAAPAWQPAAPLKHPRAAQPDASAQPLAAEGYPIGARQPMPAWQPTRRAQPVAVGTPMPAQRRDPQLQPPQQAAPVPVWQPAAPIAAPQASQPYVAPAPLRPYAAPQPAQPSATPAGAQPAARRVWTQTLAQQAPLRAPLPPRPAGGDTVPVAAFVPRPAPEPTLVRREPQPPLADNPGATGDNPRRRRIQAHLERSTDQAQAAAASRYPTPAFGQPSHTLADSVPDFAAAADVPDASAALSGAPYDPSALDNLPYGALAQAASMGFAPRANAAPAEPRNGFAPHGATEPRPAPEPPDMLDDDSARFEAVSSLPLAEPMPVPTFGSLLPHPPLRHKRRGLRNTLIVLLVLGAILFALYQSGLGARLWQNVFPAAGNGNVPSIFGQNPADSVSATIAPASQVTLPELKSVTVDPATATAPAKLTFQIETNAATSAILLLTEGNATLHTTAYGTPKGDGLLWQVEADLQTAYSGKVRVFLRDQAGSWSEGALSCTVDVK